MGSGSIGGYNGLNPKREAFINVTFNRSGGSLTDALRELKALVKEVESVIEDNFARQCSGEFRSFSQSRTAPSESKTYQVGA